VAASDFDLTALPRHLRMRFVVEDDDGTVVASGRDLGALSVALGERARRAVAAVMPSRYRRSGLQQWPGGDLPRMLETEVDGRRIVAYPTLVDEGASVGVRLVIDAAEQERLMAAGTRRLLLLAVPRAQAQVERRLRGEPGMGAVRPPAPGIADLAADCATAAADRLIEARGGAAWDEDGYRRLEDAARERLAPLAVGAAAQASAVVIAAAGLASRLEDVPPALAAAAADIRDQLARLVHPGFVAAAGITRLQHLARYVEAVRLRLDKLRERPDRDRDLMARVQVLESAYDDVVAGLPAGRRADADVVEVRWMLEELRVSLFAQILGTAQPVSEQRVRRALAALA
jgi:ATP-dependent helicase HrpA